MRRDSRTTAFAAAIVVVCAAAVALALSRPQGALDTDTRARTVPPKGARSGHAGERVVVQVGTKHDDVPVPSAAWRAARARAAREAAAREARVVGVAVADDPVTTALEMAATLRTSTLRTTLVLVLEAEGTRWRVTGVR